MRIFFFNVWLFLSFVALKIKWQFTAMMGNSTRCLQENKEEEELRIPVLTWTHGGQSSGLQPLTASARPVSVPVQGAAPPQHTHTQHFRGTRKTFLGVLRPNPILLTHHSIKIYYCNREHFHASWKQDRLKEWRKGNSIGQ